MKHAIQASRNPGNIRSENRDYYTALWAAKTSRDKGGINWNAKLIGARYRMAVRIGALLDFNTVRRR